MNLNEFLISLGIKIPDLVSGFCGGVVNALFFQRTNPGAAIASVIGGAITANFLAATASKISGADEGVAGFIVGVTAMAICQGLFSITSSWIKKFQVNPDA